MPHMHDMLDSDGSFEFGSGDDAEIVDKRFWKKVRRTVGLVPFLDEAIAAYYCAIDPQTPRHVQVMLLGALAYFVVPADMIPDFIVGLGFTDDATVLAAVIGTVRRYITSEQRERAQWVLNNLGGKKQHPSGDAL